MTCASKGTVVTSRQVREACYDRYGLIITHTHARARKGTRACTVIFIGKTTYLGKTLRIRCHRVISQNEQITSSYSQTVLYLGEKEPTDDTGTAVYSRLV